MLRVMQPSISVLSSFTSFSYETLCIIMDKFSRYILSLYLQNALKNCTCVCTSQAPRSPFQKALVLLLHVHVYICSTFSEIVIQSQHSLHGCVALIRTKEPSLIESIICDFSLKETLNNAFLSEPTCTCGERGGGREEWCSK